MNSQLRNTTTWRAVTPLMLGLIAALATVGCGQSSSPSQTAGEPSASAGGPAEDDPAVADVGSPAAFQLGDMLEPFDPPPLEELRAAHEWIDRPVVDGMERMREHKASLPSPELTVQEALALRNDSREDNELIADTLGRLAPPDGDGVDYDAEVVMVADMDLKSTNPLLGSSVAEFDYGSLTGFGLFGFDWEFRSFASGDAVVSWETSDDRLVDIIVMRDDLTWSDGTPITAHDIAYTFQVIMSDAVLIPAVRSGTDELRWVHAYDDHTVAYFHKDSLATNEWNLNFPIIPKHKYEEAVPEDPSMSSSDAFRELENNPVVGGMYTLDERITGQEFVVRRREDYFMHDGEQVRDKPYFATVRYKVIEDRNTALLALKNGEVHSFTLLADQWQNQTNGNDFYRLNTKVSGLEWTSFHFCWNTKSPIFSDKRVRWAMTYAMDHEELLNTLFYGLYEPGQGTFHPTSRMFPKDAPEPIQQDLDKAEDLLDEAGWNDSDGDGIRDKMIDGRRVPFRFTILCSNEQSRINICILLKESLESIGIECNVKPTEFTVLQENMRTHNFEAAFGGWGTGADPDTSTNIWVTGEGRNYGQYSNLEVDRLFTEAKREFDPEKRSAMYGQIHMLLWEDQPYTWLYYRNSFFGFNKRMRGYNFSPRGPFGYSPGFSSVFFPADVP